jgi:5,5'-dehydrodivanillate O-demethylase
LTAERPKKRVKILCEELVLYRDPNGGYGLVDEHCSHRGTSLYYGFVEERGIRCPYHGWLYDASGRCLEQPFEPEGATFCQRIKHRAYPVQKLAGLLFAYMGPAPAPLLPRWDVLVREDGLRKLATGAPLNCNWVQAQENSIDPTHSYFLHGRMFKERGIPDSAGYTRPFLEYGFQPFEWGLLSSWHWGGDGDQMGEERAGGNPLIFPNALGHAAHYSQWLLWRMPIDDTHTQIFSVEFRRFRDGRTVEQLEEPAVSYIPSWIDANGEYAMDSIIGQDTMAWETQGPVADRTEEHLGASDRGIVLFRQMLREQIEIIQRGGEPMGLVRDPEKNKMIELPGLFVEGDLQVATVYGKRPLAVKSMNTMFDKRHQVFEVPFGAARPPTDVGSSSSS